MNVIRKGLDLIKSLFLWIVPFSLGKSRIPSEIEKKWIVPTGKISAGELLSFLPQEFSVSKIVQTYLDRPDRPDIECRVRKQTFPNKRTVYWYTEKTKTKIDGKRKEIETKISLYEYEDCILEWADPTCTPIIKMRYVFYYIDPLVRKVKGELDVYYENLDGLVTFEVELARVADLERISPPYFCAHAIAVNGACSNHHLARHGITPELLRLINS